MRRIDISGFRFGRLIAKEAIPGKTKWLCVCDCGATVEVSGTALRSGDTRSCGCLRREMTAARARVNHRRHGHHGSVEYMTWTRIRNRCRNPNHQDWANYGGRGIKVCDRWDSFELFLADMGPRPSGTSIDRIDVNGNYEPTNCRWATPTEQARNKRTSSMVTFRGRTQCISAWAEEYGVSKQVLLWRIRSGWEVEKALTAPIGSVF